MGGSFKLLFIATSKTYRMYGLYIISYFYIVQEAKELAEIQDIKHSFMFFHGLQYASNGQYDFIAIT